MSSNRNDKIIRLRPVTEQAIGTTAFFRNRALYEVLFEELKNRRKSEYSVLFHAASIGAEAYSFVIHYLVNGYSEDFALTVHATDLEPAFVEFGSNGRYPPEILDGLRDSERPYFLHDGETACVAEDVKRHVKFLDAVDFTEFEARQEYDVVFLLNALIYVPAERQASSLDRIASYNTQFLVTTGFHMDSIRTDLVRNAYLPVEKDLNAIHDGWTDRRTSRPVTDNRPGIYADWTLPAYAEIDDYQYKYCSLFAK